MEAMRVITKVTRLMLLAGPSTGYMYLSLREFSETYLLE